MKTQTIQLLADLRQGYRITTLPGPRHGFKQAAWRIFKHIEATTPADELWTSLPDENELTEHSRIGDHLSVTRRLMGFIA